ncbi:MAG: hypothetical protein ACRCXZ_01390 [Patescibacteria group bacterium]
MNSNIELLNLSITDFKELIERFTLAEKRELLPELNKFLAIRKVTWAFLLSGSSKFSTELPMEAQFTYQMLTIQVHNYDKALVTEMLIDTFNRIKENEETNRHQAHF